MSHSAKRFAWEDFAPGSVREFGGHTLTREEITRFAAEFDPQPFHLDEEAAKASLFGGLAASGWHTCALVMRMMCDNYLLDSTSLGSPGIDKLRWLRPVKVGDTLHVRMHVLEARPMASKPHVGLVLSQWEVLNQRDEPVLTMEGWGMFGRRDVAPPATP
ncbi:MaoC family dehydratase [Rivibacter subsaxonicus]|uniref:Acyl dehydratase n=1 Tax=Rivibacter subsaxonicus TaxID=457575 RepID=A0A4Q7VWJ5_9BURK|nr:MaoC family dehydratase [Rivibacter subsaxonicus]RZU01040.1 acyl dehydratase [Rivibacter subsaxonicus]